MTNHSSNAQNYYKSFLEPTECKKRACVDLKSDLNLQLTKLDEKRKRHEEAVQLKSSSTSVVSISHEQSNFESMRFCEFSNVFASEQLAELRSIGISEREDSTFILSLMRMIYADELTKLKVKSVSGRTTKKDQPKQKFTPEKEKIIRKMYAERLIDVKDNNRANKLNKLIKNALRNIVKSIEAKENEKKIARRLDFND